MKKIFYLLSVFALAASCSQPSGTDKKAELIMLKRQQGELSEKISKLEKELAVTDTSSVSDKVKNVSVTTAQFDTFYHYIEVQAKVEGDQDIVVSAESMGNVTDVFVNAGDKVSKGQLLASIDDRIIRQGMSEVQSQLDLATTLYYRQKNLWDQKIGSEVQYLSAKTNKEALERRLSSMREQWELTRIKSPINGVVDAVNIKEGQTMVAGFPAFRVVNLTSLKVKAEIAEAYIDRLSKGSPAIIYFPDLNKELLQKVAYSGKAINPVNRTFNVEVRIDSGSIGLRPNMIAVLKVVDYSNANACVVPVGTVQKSSDGSFVFVAEESAGKMIAKRKPVKMGMVYNGQAEITEGIAEGDKLITVGYQNLVEGDLIKL